MVLICIDFIILLRRIYRLMRLRCYGILKHMMQMQHNLFSRLSRVSLHADLVQCIPFIYSTRIEASLLSHQLDTSDHTLDMPLVYTNHKHIPLYLVSFFKSWTNSLATTCVICSGTSRMLLPRGMWWTLAMCAAFAIGGWRVVAG